MEMKMKLAIALLAVFWSTSTVASAADPPKKEPAGRKAERQWKVELDAVERAVYDLQQGRKTDAQRGQHAWEKAQQSEKAEALAKSRLRNDIAAIKRAIYEIQESRSKEAQRRQQAWEEGERRKKEVAAREAKRKNEFNALKREVHELREAVEMLRKQLSQVQSARNTSGRN